MNNNYTPKTIDLSDIELSDELMELRELLAENVHEEWASSRIEEGWIYGKERNDERKEHPCLFRMHNS